MSKLKTISNQLCIQCEKSKLYFKVQSVDFKLSSKLTSNINSYAEASGMDAIIYALKLTQVNRTNSVY